MSEEDALPLDERYRRLAAAAPPALAEKIRSALLTGERKPVTAVFADVVGSTALAESMDAEDWTLILNGAFERMAEAVYRYEGTIAQLTGDGLLAFFGAPVAHEDDPERAVRAGLDMLAGVNRYSDELHATHGIEFQIRIGMNSGPVVVGNVGSDLRYEYTALGDAVNVAARVQAAARPGSILVTDATYRFVAHAVEATDLGELQVKGRTEPVHMLEVVALAAQPGRPRGIPGLSSPLVGRDADLARLEHLLAATRSGRGGAAFVLGEPGLGKSRLLAELRQRADGLAWVEVQCPSYGVNLAYGLLLDLIRAVLEQTGGRLGDRPGDDAFFLAHLLGVELDDSESARLEPQAFHAGYLAAVQHLLRSAAARRPLVLACEDIHWADHASAEILTELLPVLSEAPLLLLCTSRLDRDAPGWGVVTKARDLVGDDLCEVVLAPLSNEESQELVRQLLEIESLPSGLRSLILTRAAGNPLYVEEVIRMLIDEAVIVREGSRWLATGQVTAVTIPPTVHGLLLARIDRLSEDARRTLRVASVVGEEFAARIVREVLADELAYGPAMSEIEASGFVGLETAQPELVYAFRHALVREAAYESLLRQERRRLHAAVGETLERLHGDAPEFAGVVALHFEQAGEQERALPYLIRAGGHALQHFAVREARAFLDRAAEYIPTGDVRRRVEVGLDRYRAGHTFIPFDQELELLAALLPLAQTIGDVRLEGEVHLGIVRTLQMKGDHGSPDISRSLERARAIGEELDDDHFRALPMALEGMACFDAAEYRAAAAKLEHVVPLLEQDRRLAEASYFGSVLALVYARLGEFARADQLLPRATELADRSGDPNAILDADIIRGYVESARGNLEEGIELARRGVELAEKVGNTLCAVVGSYSLGEQHLRRGDIEQAIPALERSTELAEYCDAGPIALLSRACLASVRAVGDAEGALTDLESALGEVRELGDPLGEAEILRQRAAALMLLPETDWELVAADFEAAIATFERLEARPYLARALQEFGLALQTVGRTAEAEEKVARATDLFQAMDLWPLGA